MTESSDGLTQSSPSRDSFFGRRGLLLWTMLPFIAAVPTWLLVFPESYDRAFDFVVDALFTALLLLLLGLVLKAALRGDSATNVVTYLFVVITGVVVFVSIWNLTALYSRTGLEAIRPLGWAPMARPSNIGLVFLLCVVALAAAAAGLQKRRSES